MPSVTTWFDGRALWTLANVVRSHVDIGRALELDLAALDMARAARVISGCEGVALSLAGLLLRYRGAAC